MSLINKMLQDLDARGTPTGPAAHEPLRSVSGHARRLPPRAVWLGAAAVLAVLAAGFGWRFLHRPSAPVAPALRAPLVAPARPDAPLPAPAPAVAAPASVASAPPAAPAESEAAAPPAPRRAVSRAVPAEAAPAPQTAPSEQIRAPNPQQRAEHAYRRALDALQDGRATEAIAGLRQALAIEPRHDAARETLIRLLIENRRQGEAMLELRQGLDLDPAQPAQAMLLARLQIEQGGPALDTLQRTLPFAAGNAQYQAFLAATLQRQQRHQEAIEHYELALRAGPQQGVWWIGLGISLQALQRLPEAAEAFGRAKAGPGLTPELQAFIERKLELLAR